MFIRALTGAATAVALVAGPAAVATAAPAPAAATTIYYSNSRAAELADLVDQAAEVWNKNVKNVHLEKGGQSGVAVSTLDNGPAPGEASCVGCTRGTIKLYRKQIDDSGASKLRVIVHEFGHILGLNHPSDIGNCDKVMAGGRCQNSQPSKEEIADVERYWGGRSRVAQTPPTDEAAVWNAPAL